jgi:hypothetical protein
MPNLRIPVLNFAIFTVRIYSKVILNAVDRLCIPRHGCVTESELGYEY